MAPRDDSLNASRSQEISKCVVDPALWKRAFEREMQGKTVFIRARPSVRQRRLKRAAETRHHDVDIVH
jgi:hypothetical protein